MSKPTVEQINKALIEAEDRLMSARCKSILTCPWHATFASLFIWKASKMVPTMGVRMISGGRVECLYNPFFVAALAPNGDEHSINRLIAVIRHEVEHIVRLHPLRGNGKIHHLFNVSCDFLVNGPESAPYIQNLPLIPILTTDKDGKPTIKKDEEGNDMWDHCCYLPVKVKGFPGANATSEEIYAWLLEQPKKACPVCGAGGPGGKKGTDKDKKKGKGGQGDKGGKGEDGDNGKGKGDKDKGGKGDGGSAGDGDQPGDGEGDGDQPGNGSGPCNHQGSPTPGNCPNCSCDCGSGIEGIDGVLLDDHKIWDTSTADQDEARQMVKDMVGQANQAGSTPGHLVEAIKELNDPEVNWKYELKQLIGREVGGKRVTYARRARRHQRFGVPGTSSHASIPLTVLVDTSGSVSSELLKQFFTEIEAISQQFKIMLVQFDHAIHYCEQYHRGDWSKIGATGRGGTSFDIAINGIIERGVVGRINIILTDGYCSFPPEPDFPVIWCCSTEVEIPWGQVIKIKQK